MHPYKRFDFISKLFGQAVTEPDAESAEVICQRFNQATTAAEARGVVAALAEHLADLAETFENLPGGVVIDALRPAVWLYPHAFSPMCAPNMRIGVVWRSRARHWEMEAQMSGLIQEDAKGLWERALYQLMFADAPRVPTITAALSLVRGTDIRVNDSLY